MKIKISVNLFTFVELAFSLAMLAILIIVAMQFFKTSTETLNKASEDKEAYRNARITFDMISRDLNSVYYNNSTIPFWHKPFHSLSGDDIYFSDQLLAFIADFHSGTDTISKLGKVKYQLWYEPDTSVLSDSIGWLMRSVTSSSDTSKGSYTSTSVRETGSGNTFTANNDSCAAYDLLVPYVLNISYKCLKYDDTETDSSVSQSSPLPYSVEIKLTVLDKNTWAKWIKMGGHPGYYDSSTGSWSDLEPPSAKTYRQKHEKTFTRTILIGNRGQYN